MSEYDSWDEDLTESQLAELRRTTRPQDRAILLKCALKEYDEKCMGKIKSILRKMFQDRVNLDLVLKYCRQNIEERRNYEIIADNVSEIQRSARGIKRKRSNSRRRSSRKTSRKTRRN